MQVKAGAAAIIRELQSRGFQALVVGGCVRDTLLGRTPAEWDLTTSARPAEVKKLFKKVVPTGLKYGTVTVILDDGQYEVTTFRSDERYVDGRHPDNVRFTDDIHQDLARRDFTVNALAYDPQSDTLIDDHGGRKDLASRLLRTVGDPVARFSEDGLRPLRGCRLAATLGFRLEAPTLAAMAKTGRVAKKVALERVHDELVKLLAAEKPSVGLEYMRQAGLLALFLPELSQGVGIKQPPEYHQYDVYWHNLYACDAAPRDQLTVRLAALLHDIGKPACQHGMTFYDHDQTGAKMAAKLLRRLKFSNADIEATVNLIANHMFDYRSGWSDAAVRRFLRRIGGLDNVAPLFALRRADTAAMRHTHGTDYLTELQQRIDRIVAAENALQVSALKVDGRDVMKTLKIKPGPQVGQVLHALLEQVLDDPKLNEKTTLLKLIKKHV
ncbi:MAG: HD domain-containing protein [Candidatus Margulisbacteria bacterium]|jgi:poly(A) polymerase/tRNA nucleotidyltransferase (CCA-adding enzyme)|nr:HD domain-containing protein [Candidatus Margulisiibacteriota bacterium]